MRRPFLLLPMVLAACGGSTAPTPPPVGAGDPAALTITGPFRDGDVIAYRVVDGGGKVLGRAHSRFVLADDRPQIVTRLAFGAPATVTLEYATTIRKDLSPVAFKRLSSVDGRLELVFRMGFVSVVTDAATKEVPYQADGAVLLPSDDLVLLALAIEQAKVEPGTAGSLKVRKPDTAEIESWPIQVYADSQRQTVVQFPGGKATLDPRGRIAALETKDGRTFELEEPAGDPPALLPIPIASKYERSAQAGFGDRSVVIDVLKGQLSGTLSMPKFKSRFADGRAPAVLFVGDLGLKNRHGFTHELDRGSWQILDRLAEESFAVLRVDDRGAGPSTSSLPAVEYGLERAVEDVRAQIVFLASQSDVDPKRIFLIGHGMGALIALEVAAQEELAGVALLAPAYRAGVLLAGKQDSPLTADLAKLDATALLKKVGEPIAVVQGMRDIEVSWREDAQALTDVVNKQKRGQAKLYIYEYVDHLLKTQSGTSTLESYKDKGRRVDAKLLDDLVAWLQRASSS